MDNIHLVYQKIINGVENYFKKANIENAVIGVSGGVDSALTLKIAVDALGPNKVTAVLMPEKGITSEENMIHAKTLCEFLKVEYHTISINKYLTDFLALPWQPNDLAQINLKARIRMIILYNFANTRNALVLGTSNKTELALGYCTKHGDLACDLEVIGDLFKEDVYSLAEFIGLPDEFIQKAPSAELYTGQTDEDELGITYREIDNILRQIENGATKDDLIGKGINPNSVHKVFRLIELNGHKLLPASVIKAH